VLQHRSFECQLATATADAVCRTQRPRVAAVPQMEPKQGMAAEPDAEES
jgi:hypothetical protein